MSRLDWTIIAIYLIIVDGLGVATGFLRCTHKKLALFPRGQQADAAGHRSGDICGKHIDRTFSRACQCP
jgi:hypothetical protein